MQRMKLQSRKVAIQESCNPGKLQSRKVAIQESCNPGKLQSRKASIQESCNPGKLQSRKVAMLYFSHIKSAIRRQACPSFMTASHCLVQSSTRTTNWTLSCFHWSIRGWND